MGILETVLFDRNDFRITFFSIRITNGSDEQHRLIEAVPGMPKNAGLYSREDQVSTADFPAKTLIGLPVYSRDGLLGTTSTVVVDDTSWTIRYLIVDMKNAEKNSRVPVDTGMIDNFDAKEGCVFIDASLEELYA